MGKRAIICNTSLANPNSPHKKGKMMLRFLIPVGIAVAATFLYHIAAKLTPVNVSPLLSLAVTYLLAALFCVALLFFFPLTTSWTAELGRLNWASVGLAVAVTGIEIGFLLAYRVGWGVSLTTIVVNVSAAALLLPTGLLLFQERINPINLIGVLVCLIGLAMINQR
jgi:drug/metabolite transporter (DMT)-like permease